MQLILPIIALIMCICACVSCEGRKHIGQAEAISGEEIPAMITHDVIMLISDSGIIKYRATTPKWTRFEDEAAEPYQYFPEGVFFEQVTADEADSVFASQETIVADTAYNFENRQLWRLIGNVEVVSIKGELFRTQELFWDMKKHTVYNDSFIHIERQENIIEGYGFESDDAFTRYTINKTSGIFPARENPINRNSTITEPQGSASVTQE